MKGAPFASVPTVCQLEPSKRWKATEAIPEPPGSVAEAVSETEPRRFAPGSSSELVGSVLSTVTVRSAEVKRVARRRRS